MRSYADIMFPLAQKDKCPELREHLVADEVISMCNMEDVRCPAEYGGECFISPKPSYSYNAIQEIPVDDNGEYYCD
jgi:hypothetical protein